MAALVGVIAFHGLIALVLVRALADHSPGGLDDRALRRQTTAIVIVLPPPPSIVHGKARVMAKAQDRLGHFIRYMEQEATGGT